MENSSKIKQNFYMCFGKRFCDVILSIGGILVLFPVLLGIAIAIKLETKGPVLFCQKRVGKGKTHFEIFKFRTMHIDTPHDVPTHLLQNPEQWITKVGAFLRHTSLDELPQIFNIFIGQMSVIGPRPALWNQYDLIEARDEVGANDLRPGLTGLAQINGRDELSIKDKVELDAEYCKKVSFVFDVKMFIGTVFSVLKKDGIREGCEQNEKTDDEK